jgi:ribosomal-protein-serine acetyltransferase
VFTCRISEDVEVRLIEERHAAALFALVQQNHARLLRWVPWLHNTATEEGTRAFVRRRLQRLAENNGWAGGLFYRGSLAGEIGFDYIDWPNRCTEIGYWVGAAFEGKGLVSRACRALVQHAFAELGLHRVQIRCASDNTRSRAIPERLGFKQEGVLRGIERLHDRYVDLVVYGMLAEEWQAEQPGGQSVGG